MTVGLPVHPLPAGALAPVRSVSAAALRRAVPGFGRLLGRALLGLLLPAGLLALWWVATVQRWLPEQILPPPALVLQSLRELAASGELLDHLAISGQRVGWSLLIGGGGGLLIGLAMGLSRTLQAYLYPSFDVISQFPVLGWIPLLIIAVGIDEPLKVAAISLAVVVPVALNTLHGVRNVPPALLEVASVYRMRLGQVIWRVVLPAAGPSLFTALRQGVMQAWLTLVFVELLASSEGIGYLMVWGRQLMQMDLVVVGMVVIGLVGGLLELLLRGLERRLQRGRPAAF